MAGACLLNLPDPSMHSARRVGRSNQRKAQRLPLPIAVTYRLLPPHRSRRPVRLLKQPTLIRNVSGTGIRLAFSEPLDPGDRLEVALTFPQDHVPLAAISKVVWCRRRSPRGVPVYDVGLRHLSIRVNDQGRFVTLFCETMLNWLLAPRRLARTRRARRI